MDDLYKHWLNRFVMTVGVKAEADENGSHWFADVVGSYQIYPDLRQEEFQVWRLVVHPGRIATVIADDGNGRELVRQDIEYTDHPEPGTEWRLVGAGGQMPVLMLPCEY